MRIDTGVLKPSVFVQLWGNMQDLDVKKILLEIMEPRGLWVSFHFQLKQKNYQKTFP